jgi:hypothetical protein
MSLIASAYLDLNTGQQSDILYERELSYDECAQAVESFKPSFVIRHAEADIFLVVPNENWKPQEMLF